MKAKDTTREDYLAARRKLTAARRAADPAGCARKQHEAYLRWKARNPARYETSREKSKTAKKKRRAERPDEFADMRRRWRAKNPEKVRAANAKGRIRRGTAYRLLWAHGITVDEREELLKRQHDGCAICGRPDGATPNTKLHVDHDHATGRIRGLLCGPCNRALGMFRDDVERLAAAIAYLSGL